MFFGKSLLKRVFVVIVVVAAAVGGAYYWQQRSPAAAPVTYKTPQEADVYIRFDMEAYDKIKQLYWQKVEDKDLAQLYQLSIQKALGTSTLPALASTTRAGTAAMLADAFAQATSTDAKKQLARNIIIVALYNIAPVGRDQLLSSVQETQLRQEVANINPAKDLYSDVGASKGATPAEVDAAYKQKAAALAASSSPAAKEELKKVAYAHQVLTNTNDKARYDQAQVEPTVFSHRMGNTLYLYLSQISPTTLQEFAQEVDAASTTPGLSSMIIDLRGNIGGALDFATYFLGLFIGPNQYAFDFFHQGDYLPQRTAAPKFDELNRYKEIAILTNNMTQSTAEVITAMFKRFNLGHVVGGTTRGWGTVENTTPLETVIDPNEKYSLLLVQYITLRDDNIPVEGRGVDPNVNIADKNWKSQLSDYFHSQSLINALESEAAAPPLR